MLPGIYRSSLLEQHIIIFKFSFLNCFNKGIIQDVPTKNSHRKKLRKFSKKMAKHVDLVLKGDII